MNRKKRLLFSAVLAATPSLSIRMKVIKRFHLFGSVGENCKINNKKVPLYSNLIFIHDNVIIATDVHFTTHDGIHFLLNNQNGGRKFMEKVGCIEIMNNVFVGSGTRILYNTRIGNNVIIGAGSLVNKDIPDNSVYAGVPARRICSFDEYVEKHRAYSDAFRKKFGLDKVCGVDDTLAAKLYGDFQKSRDK